MLKSKKKPVKHIPLEDGDYYFDGMYMVFTANYHLKRGTCCGSGCRHCPFQKKKN